MASQKTRGTAEARRPAPAGLGEERRVYTVRDPEVARRFVLQGLWWQRVLPPRPATVRTVLEWAMEAASGGQPLPPIGFLADLGHVALGQDQEDHGRREALAVPALPINLLRTYEDHVLGKFYADWTFGRASDAIRGYKGTRDQARGLAFLLKQFGERSKFPGVELSPGVIKAALETPPEEIHNEGWESLRQDGADPQLVSLYESLVTAARRTAEVLSPEDVFQLENGTALAPEGEQLAQRQILRAATTLEGTLPRHRIRPPARRMEVPTRILDEDTYPVGGFTSISTRGSVESLLHSQLAYMEKDDRPDLFDIKFLRDELLYYSRDENQFLRRRRTFAIVFQPDLVSSRFKDAKLPYQRGVLLLALVVTVIRKLTEWLTTDALSFRLLFVKKGEHEPLAAERLLLEQIFREQIALGTVSSTVVNADEVGARCTEWARRSLVHCLVLGVEPGAPQATDTVVTRMQVASARPALGKADEELTAPEGEEPVESWGAALQHVLQQWV
jgi:hypothetical protein